jgi:methyl-accepting chemotaxis protein
MGDIVASVRQVNEVIERINAASAEQAQGITEVNKAVAQIDDVTQQNAALVEQAAGAAASLQDQASHLADAIAVFELDVPSGVRRQIGQTAAVPSDEPVSQIAPDPKSDRVSGTAC